MPTKLQFPMQPKATVAKGRKSKKFLGRFDAIDQHVRNTPVEATESLQSLAEYLNSAASTDLERVRAIYRWITENIAYDADGVAGKRPWMPVDAWSVLKNRMCVCDGYTRIMVALCKMVGVECERLFGYCKSSTIDSRKSLEDMKPDHGWNAVKLDGQWRFIEATWGAGSVGPDGRFVKKQSDWYFLMDPEIFIESHFPFMVGDMEENEKWQLLDDPIDLKTFSSRVWRTKSCFDHNVEIVSHKQTLIETTDEVTLKFRGTGKRLTGFGAYFVDQSTGDELKDGSNVAVLLDPRTNEVTVVARPPTSCVYSELRVFGTTMKRSGGMKIFDMLVSYWVRAIHRQKVSRFPFPKNFDHYGIVCNPMRCGYANDLGPFWVKAEGGEHEIRLPVTCSMSRIAKFCLCEEDKSTNSFRFMEVEEGFVRISLRMYQPGYHMLRLFGKDLLKSNVFPIANFLIECTRPMTRPRPFPTTSAFALRERVTLASPRDGALPANSEVEFRLNSPTLSILNVNGLRYPKTAAGFRFRLKTGAAGEDLKVYGAVPDACHFEHIFTFRVVAAS